jgi:hypothetical protein
LTCADTSFSKGVLRSKSKARRFLLHADTLLKALQLIKITPKRMQQCCEKMRLIIFLGDLQGRAWRLADSGTSTAVPKDKAVAHWRLLMIEVNWDLHLASVRHIWINSTMIADRIEKLLEAIETISIINKAHHQDLPANILAVIADKPVVVWLDVAVDLDHQESPMGDRCTS